MDAGLLAQAAGLFAVTNIDDILVLALFFAQGAGQRGSTRTIATGHYLGFAAILTIAAAASLGATLLPSSAIPYLGLLPLVLGVRAGIQAWRDHGTPEDGSTPGHRGPRAPEVAAVTFANGGDNIGVYVPVFAGAGAGGTTLFVVVFLILLAVWIAAGRSLAARPAVARVLSRWGHVLLPVVLIGIGLLILVEGGAFGLPSLG
ncbi:cadmium resistance transporter [Kineosporia succinea]|uniref:cadmium resistance transporter n=1 Tax=Kineosporia succinea TaxID=84632 RepID=UPI003520AB1B